jgi:hypothetical protein
VEKHEWRRGSGAGDDDVRGAVTRRNVTLLERNGPGAHDRVVLVDELRPSLWAAKWVQVRHAQMVATKNLESRELAQAGRQRDRHPCLDPRAVGGVLGRVDPAVGVHPVDEIPAVIRNRHVHHGVGTRQLIAKCERTAKFSAVFRSSFTLGARPAESSFVAGAGFHRPRWCRSRRSPGPPPVRR